MNGLWFVMIPRVKCQAQNKVKATRRDLEEQEQGEEEIFTAVNRNLRRSLHMILCRMMAARVNLKTLL